MAKVIAPERPDVIGGTLELSAEEVRALASILRRVGGVREHGREHIDAILRALATLAPGANSSSWRNGFDLNGEIYFTSPVLRALITLEEDN